MERKLFAQSYITSQKQSWVWTQSIWLQNLGHFIIALHWLITFYCLVAKSSKLFCNFMDYSAPGYSVHGISQARILEGVAISFSRGSSWPRDSTWVSCLAGRFFTAEPLGKPYWLCCCSVNQLCLTLCNPMDCSTPGFPVLHHHLELNQIHVHWVDAIQPFHPLSSPSPAFNLSQYQGLL